MRRLLLGLGVGLALLLGPLAVRLFDNVWLVRLLDAMASGERQNFLLGLTCGGAWVVLAVLNALAFRLRPSASTRRAGAAMALIAPLVVVALLTAPDGTRMPAHAMWDRRVDWALPGFFDGWYVGAALLFVLGGGLLLVDFLRERRRLVRQRLRPDA